LEDHSPKEPLDSPVRGGRIVVAIEVGCVSTSHARKV
jgi:hypothetical protein